MKDSTGLSALDDSQLILHALGGSQQAFTLLHSRYAPRICSYCYRLLGDRYSAEEAVQSAFIKAFQSLRSLDHSGAFKFWLFSVARNEVYALLRKRRRNGTLHVSTDEDAWIEDSVHDAVVNLEFREAVESCLNDLKHEYREVLILRHFEELSYAEISAVTGHSIESIESRLFRARKAILKRMKPFMKEWEGP